MNLPGRLIYAWIRTAFASIPTIPQTPMQTPGILARSHLFFSHLPRPITLTSRA
jgi:hypothetical protein